MIDPATLTAGVIAKLAFNEFMKAGAGEAAKATVAGAVELVKGLRNKIREKFKGNDRATAAIVEVEQGNDAALEKVVKYLDLEMDEDPEFRGKLQQAAQKIINIQDQSTTFNQQNLNYGRDQNIFNQPQGDIRIGGS
ncbi:hypothetical protein ACQ4M4_12180 [Leptolyngbya sp. AN02str]|uniref:hypothetical protein n=1 Tax=Leptolyngbya sp. AN02str TaxID=3423363 RepID=UPI003D3205B2